MLSSKSSEKWPKRGREMTFRDMQKMDGGLKTRRIAGHDEDVIGDAFRRGALDFGDDVDSAQNISPTEMDCEMVACEGVPRQFAACPGMSPLKSHNHPSSQPLPAKSPLRTLNKSASGGSQGKSPRPFTQHLVPMLTGKASKISSPQPPITSAFPVTKRAPMKAHTALSIGGAGRSKRDHLGRCCVSEAFGKLTCSDESSDPGQPTPKRKPEANPQSAITSESQQPEDFVRPPVPARRNSKNVIGDLTRDHLLPTVRGRHSDLKCISAATLTDVMNGELDSEEIEKLCIVDCRYPYEFAAGHIKGAVNTYHKEDLTREFFVNPYVRQNSNKRVIVVFHCEFSSERGPSLARFMRNEDRMFHKKSYPYLAYPEIYLLDGGYKAFFEISKSLCDPPFYTPMTCEKHREDLHHFKAKARSFHDFSAALPQRRPPAL